MTKNSTIVVKLQPVEFDKVDRKEKIHHLLRGKAMNSVKVGDSIKFTCNGKSRTRKIIGSEKASIKNRQGQFPLVTVKNGKSQKNLATITTRAFAGNNGNAGVVGLLIGLGLNEGLTAHCKVIHFTGFKYF